LAPVCTKKLRGKLYTVIERIEHGHHVFRAYWKNGFLKQYEKFATFLRNELCSNNLSDFALKKGDSAKRAGAGGQGDSVSGEGSSPEIRELNRKTGEKRRSKHLSVAGAGGQVIVVSG
jgi:hypothetical protein